jgi:hypothetical protein
MTGRLEGKVYIITGTGGSIGCVLDLFHEDAEIYFQKFGRGFGRQSLFEMVKGFEGVLGQESSMVSRIANAYRRVAFRTEELVAWTWD